MTKKTKTTNKITKDMSFSEIIEKNPKAVEILLKNEMHCIGCPMAQMETLEEGARSHGLDADKLAEEINKSGE
jgi:hybrid cluster-associated redox disulfide protein|tara:strand:- start:557 stop:775 length:219 start_codon:yes stop_codon:yes gene_type:complete